MMRNNDKKYLILLIGLIVGLIALFSIYIQNKQTELQNKQTELTDKTKQLVTKDQELAYQHKLIKKKDFELV